jgi:hypothetical protein
MEAVTKAIMTKEIMEEAILPIPPILQILLGLLVFLRLHAGLSRLRPIHHLQEQLTKNEETDPIPSPRNPSLRISNYNSSCSFPKMTISIQTMQTKYYSHLVFVPRAHLCSLQNYPSSRPQRIEADGEHSKVS